MKPFQFSTTAAEELTAAIRWYESRRSGLGGEFYAAVVRAIERIQEFPEIGTPRGGCFPHRRMRVARFVYDRVSRAGTRHYVVAVAHSRRRPGYWKNRR